MSLLSSLFSSIAKRIGTDEVAQIAEQGLIAEAEAEGEVAVEKALTIPEATVESLCEHHGLTTEQAQEVVAFGRDFALRGAAYLEILATGKAPDDSPYVFAATTPPAATS